MSERQSLEKSLLLLVHFLSVGGIGGGIVRCERLFISLVDSEMKMLFLLQLVHWWGFGVPSVTQQIEIRLRVLFLEMYKLAVYGR